MSLGERDPRVLRQPEDAVGHLEPLYVSRAPAAKRPQFPKRVRTTIHRRSLPAKVKGRNLSRGGIALSEAPGVTFRGCLEPDRDQQLALAGDLDTLDLHGERTVVHDQETEGERSAVLVSHPHHLRVGLRHRFRRRSSQRKRLVPEGEEHDARYGSQDHEIGEQSPEARRPPLRGVVRQRPSQMIYGRRPWSFAPCLHHSGEERREPLALDPDFPAIDRSGTEPPHRAVVRSIQPGMVSKLQDRGSGRSERLP